MARQEFEMVVAQMPKKRVVSLDLTEAGVSVIQNATKLFTVYSSPNTIARLRNVMFSVSTPAGATTGTHKFYLQHVSPNTTSPTIFELVATYANVININANIPLYPVDWAASCPDDNKELIEQIQNCVFDDTTGLKFGYRNGTNANLTGATIYLALVYEEEEVR